MAQADGVVANGTGAAVRSDLNDQLAAVFTNHSGSSEPSTTYAYQWWADTTANVLKIRNSANNGWITLRELDGTMLIEDGSASTPGLAFADDTNTGIFSGAADQVGFATGGAERLKLGNGEAVFNDISADTDFRVESNGQTHMLFVDAGNDRVGIGTSSPSRTLTVADTTNSVVAIQGSTSGTSNLFLGDSDDEDIGAITYNHATNFLSFTANADERARIDSSGRLLVGATSTRSNIASVAQDVVFERASIVTQSLVANQNASGGSTLSLCLSRGTSVGSNTVVQSGDAVGQLAFRGNDGTNFINLGMIQGVVDGTPGTNDMPGRLVFFTTADGQSSPTERLRIGSDGKVELRANQGTAETNIIRFTDTDSSVAAGQKFGQLQWFSNDASGGGPSVKGEIYVVARDTTPDGDMVFATHDGSGTNTAENIRLISSGGLTFNGDTAVTNALDDYDEGSFTPTYGSGISSPSYTGTEGHYTKIGNLVTFTIRIRATGTNSSSQLKIAGLPFPSNTKNEGSVSFGYMDNLNGSSGFTGHIPEQTSEIQFYQFTGSNFNGNSGNGISGRTLHMRGFYYTSS